MAARAIGTASISFGLVSVPIKLYATSESSATVSFNLLSKESGSRLKQQYIDTKTGEIVPRSEMVKGYEVSKGQYVVFSPEELKAIEAKSTQMIDIAEFVPQEQVDQVYFDKMYYLGPDKGGDRAYKLLSASLRKTGRVAVARYAARGKEYLVMIRPMGEGLVMEQLRYADEVKSFDEVPLGEAELKDAELDLAVQLIDQAASEQFDPNNYKDEVRQKVMDLVQAKIDGQDITQAEPEEPKGQIIDLMSALKASLAASGPSSAASNKERKPAKTAEKKDTKKERKVSGD
jgi:DNA end-binding protein Ku